MPEDRDRDRSVILPIRELNREKLTPVPMTPYIWPENRKPQVKDLTVIELEELIEKCVRRVLQGEDIKREYLKLRATEK